MASKPASLAAMIADINKNFGMEVIPDDFTPEQEAACLLAAQRVEIVMQLINNDLNKVGLGLKFGMDVHKKLN